ncbi:hypothetical protein B9Z55_014656 [Caenorhabditis nigoni]|uniref:SET domain-containing protein n=1 Tax=Caenorhabditis nigoni TaxID=1611254 RepID=A0A2G5U6S2_9PELO|nr:hypothetical protein B9Z55_014656 [Caenorhabditis nigoni]
MASPEPETRRKQRVHTATVPRIDVTGQFNEYNASDIENRKIMRKREAVLVRWNTDESHFYQEEFGKFYRKIKLDRDLLNYKYDWTNKDCHSQCFRVIAQSLQSSRSGKLEDVDYFIEPLHKNQEHTIGFGKYDDTYTPPARRIRITRNITFDKNDVIPVYSDLPGETLENLEIPDNFVYEYSNVNFVDKSQESDLVKAMELAQQEENLIKCNCHSGDNVVPCYENKKCPCYKMNKMLRNFQFHIKDRSRCEFSSFKPIILAKHTDVMFDNIGFSCSEMCACAGKCTNNALFLANKNIFPLEIYRQNPHVGFNIRSSVPIPAGTPFKTFTGEIRESVNVSDEDLDYAFKVWQHDETRIPVDLKDMKFTGEYKRLLLELFQRDFFICPTTYGNVGRTAGHSCVPNVEILRVYQKSVSPAHINLIMVAREDIIPGTPLTIDYGAEFAERLKDVCQCGTFACSNSKDKELFSELKWVDLAPCVAKLHEVKFEKYRETVMDVINQEEIAHRAKRRRLQAH